MKFALDHDGTTLKTTVPDKAQSKIGTWNVIEHSRKEIGGFTISSLRSDKAERVIARSYF
jgi:hypothetical protein